MFSRPVSHDFPIKTFFGEKDRRFVWSIDPDNGIWIPTRGPYGLGQHRGTDFDCPAGTPVRAMADGFIVRSRFENTLNFSEGAGLYIVQLVSLTGYDSWMLRYSHLKASYVTPGEQVCRYDPIAESGDSGDAAVPYLHVDLMNLKRQWKAVQFDS